MKKQLLVLVILAVALFAFGCASTWVVPEQHTLDEWQGAREGLIRLSEEGVLNQEALRAVSQNLLISWLGLSATIHDYLGNRIHEMPGRWTDAVAALDERYDKMIAKSLTERELLGVVGLHLRLVDETAMWVIKETAPELLARIPSAILAIL